MAAHYHHRDLMRLINWEIKHNNILMFMSDVARSKWDEQHETM